MVGLLMIADDFTGALDTGVKFSQAGALVKVIADYDFDFGSGGDENVLVINSESRHASFEEARRRVEKIVRRAKAAGISTIYKKTDSALRGNIGAELEAALLESGESILHFVPALPRMNRTTLEGIHYIDGIPVAESAFGRDPFSPVRFSKVAELIGSQSSVRVLSIGQNQDTREIFSRLDRDKKYIALYDAVSEEDVAGIVNRLTEENRLCCLAGCAGLAQYLPASLGIAGSRVVSRIEGAGGRLLILCGSVNERTVRQMAYAQGRGFFRCNLTREQKLLAGYLDTKEGREWLERLSDTLKCKEGAIIDSYDLLDEKETIRFGEQQGLDREGLRQRISARLGEILTGLLALGLEATILITGGDTLLGFMKQAGISTMRPLYEIAPGSVVTECHVGEKPLLIISKSGGFGEKELFVQILETLKSYKEDNK